MADIVRYPPFRWVWIVIAAWQLYTRWNAPRDHNCRMTFRQELQYAIGLAEMMDDLPGYISPSEAIDEDRTYWSE